MNPTAGHAQSIYDVHVSPGKDHIPVKTIVDLPMNPPNKKIEISSRTGNPKRRKAVRACTNCQRTHLTCDDNRPCERCIKRGCEDTCQDGIRKKNRQSAGSMTGGKDNGSIARHMLKNSLSSSDPGRPGIPGESIESMLFPAIPGNEAVYNGYGFEQQPPQNIPSAEANNLPTNSLGERKGDGFAPGTVENFGGNPELASPNSGNFPPNLSPHYHHSTEIHISPHDTHPIQIQKPYSSSQSYYDSFCSFTHGSAPYPQSSHYPSGSAPLPIHLNVADKLSAANGGNLEYDFEKQELISADTHHSLTGSILSDVMRERASRELENDISRGSYHAFVKSESVAGSHNSDDAANHMSDGDRNAGSHEYPGSVNRTDISLHGTNQENYNHVEPRESPAGNEEPLEKTDTIFGWLNPPPNPLTVAHNEHSSHISYGYTQPNPSEVYRLVTEPYLYRQKLHELNKFLHGRLDPEQYAQINAIVRNMKTSYQYVHKSLSRDDELFIEQCFQRSLLEEEKQFALMSVPCLVWRWTGQIAAVSPRFSKLVDIPVVKLKNQMVFPLMDNLSIVQYFQSIRPLTQAGAIPDFKFDCTLIDASGNHIKCEAEVTIRRDLFNVPLTILGKFWVK